MFPAQHGERRAVWVHGAALSSAGKAQQHRGKGHTMGHPMSQLRLHVINAPEAGHFSALMKAGFGESTKLVSHVVAG